MRRLGLVLSALSAPLSAQNAPAVFEAARSMPLSPGQWTYSATPGASEARFGSTFTIRCDRIARQVTLRRLGPLLAPPTAALTITTDLGVRIVRASGIVASGDPGLDAIAFSRGRFIIDGGGLRLVLPASPEAARSIEDCRN